MIGMSSPLAAGQFQVVRPNPLMKCNLELITAGHLFEIEGEKEEQEEKEGNRDLSLTPLLLSLSPTAVGHKFDQLVLRLQFLICRRSRDRDRQAGQWDSSTVGHTTAVSGLATVDTEHLTLQHVFNSIYTRQASGQARRRKGSWKGV